MSQTMENRVKFLEARVTELEKKLETKIFNVEKEDCVTVRKPYSQTKVRDQIWAEAVHRYKNGAETYFKERKEEC